MTAGSDFCALDFRHAHWTAFSVTIPPPPPPPAPPPPAPSEGQGQPYWNGQPTYGYQQPPTTNGLAIAALVGGIVLAPLGIILGHISLSQIKRTGEQGRGLAVAGLVIGYIFTAIWVFSIIWLLALANAVTNAFDDYESDYSSDYYTSQSYPTYSTYTTTTTPSYDVNDTSAVISNASVGDCIIRTEGKDNGDGTSETFVTPVSCSSSSATNRVISVGTSTSSCNGDWVKTDSPLTVLCLVEE